MASIAARPDLVVAEAIALADDSLSKPLCSLCHQAIAGNQRQCDYCRALACPICATTEWDWKESSNGVRHKCSECRRQTVTSSIVQRCLDQAEAAAESHPDLSAALLSIVRPWLSKEQIADLKPMVGGSASRRSARGDARNIPLPAIVRQLDRRAQDRFDNGLFDKALELWSALFEIRPDDKHICTMMVKAQVSCLERTDGSQWDLVLDCIRQKLDETMGAESFDVAIALCDLGLMIQPDDAEMKTRKTEAELRRSEQLDQFQPSPMAVIKTALHGELEAARDQGDVQRESSLMKVLEATLIQEHRLYQNLGKRP